MANRQAKPAMSATVLALAVTRSLANVSSSHSSHCLLHSSHMSASPPRQAIVGHSQQLSVPLETHPSVNRSHTGCAVGNLCADTPDSIYDAHRVTAFGNDHCQKDIS